MSFPHLPRTHSPYVTVTFMCLLDWATGYPDIWSNIILGVSMNFWVTLTFELVDRVSRLLCIMWVGLIQSVEGLTRAKSLSKEKLGLPDSWAGT